MSILGYFYMYYNSIVSYCRWFATPTTSSHTLTHPWRVLRMTSMPSLPVPCTMRLKQLVLDGRAIYYLGTRGKITSNFYMYLIYTIYIYYQIVSFKK